MRGAYLWKTLIVIGIATVLVTVGINASDNLEYLSGSLIGSVLFGGSNDHCPKDMVFVTSDGGGFCIDKYEAAPSMPCPNKNPRNQAETRSNLDRFDCESVSIAGAIPWRNISQNQAELACSKSGKRLPSSKEWYKAALGTPDRNSQWGENDCNLGRIGVEEPDATGSRKKCISSFGAYDMIGNVWEWVDATIIDGSYQNFSLPKQGFIKSVNTDGIPVETDQDIPDPNYNNDYLWIDHGGVYGIFRGGYWRNDDRVGIYSLHIFSSPSFIGTGVGFRCAK